MGERQGYWDDFPLLPAGSYRPATLIDVLCKLGVRTSGESTQVEAVREWLHDHEPSDALRRDFARKDGPWPALLAEHDTKHHPEN